MAGSPVAFQPNAFQNDAFQTGVGWVCDVDVPASRANGAGRAHRTINLEVIPSLIASVTTTLGWVPELPRPYRSPLLQAGLVEVQPYLISGRGGYEAELPKLFRAPWLQAGLVEVQPYLISGRGGYEAELPRLFRLPWLQAGLVEVQPYRISGRGGYEAELPRPFRAPWLQAGLVEVQPYTISGRGGYEAELPRPFRASWLQAGLVEVEPSIIPIVTGFLGWENQFGLRPAKPAVSHFEEWPETLVVEGEWGFEAVLPKPYRAPWPQAGLVEVEPFFISGRGGYEAEMPKQFRAPWLQAGMVEVEPFVISGRGGFEAEIPRPFRAPRPQAGLVEVEPAINLGFSGWENQLALPKRLQSAIVRFEEWPETLVVEGEWGFEAVLPRPYRAPWPQAGLVEVAPSVISGRGGYEAEMPRPFRAPWPQAGLVEVQPFVISGRGGYEAEMPRPFRAPWLQAGLVEVQPFTISGRGGFEAEIPRPFRAPRLQAGLVEVEPAINLGFSGWENQLALPKRLQGVVVHFEEWPEALVVEGEWGFEAVLPKPYRAPWPQAGLVEVEPFVLSGRSGYEAEIPRPFRAPWPQAGLVEVRPSVISGRGGYEAEMPRLFRAPWLQAGLVEVEPALKVSGSYGWDAMSLPPQFKLHMVISEDLPVRDTTIHYGFDSVLPRAYRAAYPQAKIDDWVPMIVCPTVSALQAHGSRTGTNVTTTILPFFTPAPSFILLGIVTRRLSGTSPILVTFVGGDASGLAWQKLAGGPIGATDFTVEYWGAFTADAIPFDSVDVITNDRGDTSIAFVALAGVNATPVGSVIGPTTVANNFYVAFPSTTPRSMLFAAGVSSLGDADTLTPGLNTTIYEQPDAAQFVRSTSSSMGGMLTMSTSGYEDPTTIYYLGIEILAIPCYLFGLYGWDAVVSPKGQVGYRPIDSLDVQLTPISVVYWGFESEVPGLRRPQPPKNIVLDVEPAINAAVFGWDVVAAPNKISALVVSPSDAWPTTTVVYQTVGGFDDTSTPRRKTPLGSVFFDVDPTVVSGARGWEQSLAALWKAVPKQAGHVDVMPAVFVSSYGWEQSLPGPFRSSLVRPAQFEAWPEELVVEGTWGFEQALPPTWKSVPTQAGLVEVWPVALAGRYGWEQALPALHRAAFVPPALAEVWPEEIIVEGDWGFEQALPPLWKPVATQAGLVAVWPSVLSGRYGFEQALPPSWKSVPAQAGLVEVLPAALAGRYGWEQALPALHRAAFLPPAPAEVWPEAIIVEGTWGFEQALPPLWKPVPTQAGLVPVWPAIFSGRYGWEQSLLPLHRAAFVPPAPAEVWPEAIIVEGTWGFEQSLPPSWKHVPPPQAGLVEVWPVVLVGNYGWEQSLPAPFRAAFLPVSMFESWPEALVVEGTWGFDEALPALWRAASLQAGPVDVWPAVFTSTYGWEQSLPPIFRAPFASSAPTEVWPESFTGIYGFEATLPAQFRYLYTSPQTSDPMPSTIKAWGWELPAPEPVRVPVDAYRLIEVFPTLVKPWPADYGDVNRLWQPVRRDVLFDTLSSIISESFDGWENLSPVSRYVSQQARNEEVFPPTTAQVFPWGPDLPSELLAKFKYTQPTFIDVFPSIPTQVLFPWGIDIGALQAKAGSKIIVLDDWWPPIEQPNPLLPGGGYKPSSIFERRNEDRDFINRIEQTIEAIDGELLSLHDEPDDDASAGYKVAEPDILPPGWRSGKDQAKPEPERVRHVHYNFASDLDFGVRRRIVGILDRAEHRKVDIFGSDAFVTKETARVHGQLVVSGTNAWVLRLASDARLELAKEALAEGFRLVSFDDTSLSFIHRPTYPWKQIYMGAGIGAAIMGAGVGLGYLIWGRTPPTTPPKAILQAPKAKQIASVKPIKPTKPTKPAKALKSPKPAKPVKLLKPKKP